MKILIVEDDENSRILLETALEASGYEIVSAENGRLALSLARDAPPDLIISDILMPEMDGYALCKAVKTDETLQTIPFIFYTATYTDPSDEKLAMDLGASRFIVKPTEMPIFLTEIAAVLDEYKKSQLPNPQTLLKRREEVQNGHIRSLAAKLEKKVRQLEEEKKRLSASEARYRRLVEVLREDYFLYTRDPSGAFIYVSPSVRTILGYGQAEFLENFRKYLTADPINKGLSDYLERRASGVRQRPREIEVLHKDGGIRRLELSEEPVMDEYRQVLTVEGIAHDISQRIEMENQLAKTQRWLRRAQKMEAIGNLAAGIAHDFNNILFPIIGMSEMLLEDFSPDSPERENVLEILKAGRRGRDLVQQILAFSRQSDHSKIPVRIQQVLKEVLKLCRSTIPSNIELADDLHPACGIVLADPTQLHQIAMNLITNAYHAVEPGGGTISVKLKEIEVGSEEFHSLQPGKYARLTVSDTGCGIDPTHLEAIFEPYFTTKGQGKGTGLGLAVVYGLVKDHGGEIQVYSERDKGSIFHIYLPLAEQTEATDPDRAPAPIQVGSERILLVDDDASIVHIERLMLERLGYAVTARTSSIGALEAFESDPDRFDLVITDMTMPGMTGDQFARKVNAIRADTPVIICTGLSERIEWTKAAGIKGVLMKPVLISEMARMVRKALDEARP